MNKKTKIFLIILGIFLLSSITLTTVYFINQKPVTKEEEKEKESKYNESATKVLKEKNLFSTINEKEYSKTIEVLLEENKFDEKYIDEYYKIEYNNTLKFTNYVSTLLTKSYNGEEIDYILKNYLSNIDILLDMDYINILEFKNLNNFNIDKLERYLKYQKDNDKYDLKTVVTYVNIGLDLKGYSSFKTYTNKEAEEDLTILVNKYHKLPDDYEPNDLVALSYNSGYTYKLRREAAEKFEELTSAGLLENVIFYPYSAYRSYETQKSLYNRYKERDGEEEADTYSARPGFSEHQLGLAVDVRSSTLSSNLTSNDYKWMQDNSYKYGFIIRYPKGKQHVTQFMEEPWHIRYLGVELATKVHDSGLTYDEYYDQYIDN